MTRKESTHTAKPICRFCGSDRGFDQLGTVRTEAWRKVESVSRDENGKVTPRYGEVETDSFGLDFDCDFDGDCFRCIECQREESKLESLVGEPVMFESGATVVCPDGLRGVVEHVDFERRRLTVQHWHEEFKFSEVTALAVTA